MTDLPINPRIKLIFKGAFLTDHYDATATNHMFFYLTLHNDDDTVKNISEIYKIATAELQDIDEVKQIKRHQVIPLDEVDYEALQQNNTVMKVNLLTNLEESFSINLVYDSSPLNKDIGILCAAVILLSLYVLIIWELVHRTFAAMIASTMAIGKIIDFLLILSLIKFVFCISKVYWPP